MLVCPQCQSENPNNNQTCQQCGTSLVDKPCLQCQKMVSLNQVTCSKCGALTATVWQVIVATPLGTDTIHKPLTNDSNYLDIGQRYQLWQPDAEDPLKLMATTPTHQLHRGKVIDCQPLQQSALQVLLNQSSEFMEDTDQDDATSLGEQLGIPPLALSYFALKDLSPTLPEIYDGWVDNDREIILLPDRSHWQSLSDLVISESLVTLQILYWLNQMVVLWNSLSSINCCQSLLVEENLLIDEDQSFGLQQLYPDPAETVPTLKALGQLWQKWFKQGNDPSSSKLVTLIESVADGQIETASVLRLHLQDLAADQQTTMPTDLPETKDSNSLTSDVLPEFEDQSLSGIFEETPTETDITKTLSTKILPMELVSLHPSGCTDRGLKRHHNEDYFGMKTQICSQNSNQGRIFEGRGLYIVCDGMGGHAAGEVASKMAVETLQNFFEEHWQTQFPSHEEILQGILLTNQKLYEINQNNASSGNGRMGTTLVMMLVDNTKVAIAHVGDSRIYHLTHKGVLKQLTVDHEVGQKAIQSGVDPQLAYARSDAYQLTQALGPNNDNYIQPDIQFFDLNGDSLFLLCSDGLCDNNLVDNYWETYLTPLLSSTYPLEKGLNELMDFSNQYNGHDNITAILVRMKVRPKNPC